MVSGARVTFVCGDDGDCGNDGDDWVCCSAVLELLLLLWIYLWECLVKRLRSPPLKERRRGAFRLVAVGELLILLLLLLLILPLDVTTSKSCWPQ